MQLPYENHPRSHSDPLHFADRDRDLVPRSYDYDLDRHRSRQQYWSDAEDNRRGDRGFLDKAADEVQSWFGDDEAQQRRQRDHRGRGPRGYQRSDERITEDVHHRLTEDRFLDASDIEVTVSGREVTLSGTVNSREAKRHAEDCVDEVSGVEHVQNNLRVRKATNYHAPKVL